MSRPPIGALVQRHAFPGSPYRSAFRGVVISANGRTVRVLSDDGTEWDAYPSELVADGERHPGVVRCSCCPAPAYTPRQLELFA